MPPVTRARAKAAGKPRSPAKTVSKPPARRIGKSKIANNTKEESLLSDTRCNRGNAAGHSSAHSAPSSKKLEPLIAKEAKTRTTISKNNNSTLRGVLEKVKMTGNETLREVTGTSNSDVPRSSTKSTDTTEIPIGQSESGKGCNSATDTNSRPPQRLCPSKRLPRMRSSERLMSRSLHVAQSSQSQCPLATSLSPAFALSSSLPDNPPDGSSILPPYDTALSSSRHAASCQSPNDTARNNAPRSMELLEGTIAKSPKATYLGSPRKPTRAVPLLNASPVRSARTPQMKTKKRVFGIQETPRKTFEQPKSLILKSPATSLAGDLALYRMSHVSPRRPPLREVELPSTVGTVSKSCLKYPGDPISPSSSSKRSRLRPVQSCGSMSSWSSKQAAQSSNVRSAPVRSSLRSPVRKQDEVRTLSSKKSVTWRETTGSSMPDLSRVGSVLDNCVFFVDVYASDGSDAAHLFVPLLEELGGQVLPQWSSNNLGITHVLFKDGDDRTLEKVVASSGVVKCVNVGWVVDCERFGKRLPEENYAIDLSRVPGVTPTQMEQDFESAGAAANNSSPSIMTETPTTARTTLPGFPSTPKGPTLQINTTQISITTPALVAAKSRTVLPSVKTYENSNVVGNHTCGPSFRSYCDIGEVQEDKENTDPRSQLDSNVGSPSTPYFLHAEDIELKSCPPKRIVQFDTSKGSLKQKLLLARRKSLEFAPRVSSPLRQANDRCDWLT